MRQIDAYRRYAGECLALAKKAQNSSERKVLVKIAASWHALATMLTDYLQEERLEETLMPTAAREPRKGAAEAAHDFS